jgi:hypothetical protein
MDGHTETLTAVLNINKNLTIVGGGRTDGKPTVKFTMNNAANAIMFNITGTGTPAYVRLHNVWIEENLQANTGARIASTCDTLFHMSSCYFECGQHDDGAALLLESSAGTALIENTTFISTATLNSARPHSAIQTSGTIYSVIMNGVLQQMCSLSVARFSGVQTCRRLPLPERVHLSTHRRLVVPWLLQEHRTMYDQTQGFVTVCCLLGVSVPRGRY